MNQRSTREEPSVTMHSRLEATPRRQPLVDGERRQTMRDISQVVENGPAEVGIPSQTSTERRRRANAERPATAPPPQKAAEAPPAICTTPSLATIAQHCQTGTVHAATNRQPLRAVELPLSTVTSPPQATSAAAQRQTDTENSMANHRPPQAPTFVMAGAFPPMTSAEQGSYGSTGRLPMAQQAPQAPRGSPVMTTLGSKSDTAEQSQMETRHSEPTLNPMQVAEAPLTTVHFEDSETEDILIAIMGPTGSGRSTFIRVASGLDTWAVGHTLKSFTSQVQDVRFWHQESGRHVVLVDTPGFNSTSKSDLDILEMISDWLNSSYKRKKLLSGILYFHRITDNRVAGTPLKGLRLFQKLCGKNALDKVWLTTTMWDEVDPDVGERRLDELKEEHWKTMIGKGAQVACCRSDNNSSKQIIQQILDNEAPLKALLLQEEMNNLNKELDETEAGQVLCSQLEKQAERQLLEMRKPASEVAGVQEGRTNAEHSTASQQARTPVMVVGPEDLKMKDIVIAVMGPTGSGKSTFILTASGLDTQAVGHGLRSHTDQVHAVRFWHQESDQHVVLVDTPGFDDTSKSDPEVLEMISNWLDSSHQKERLLSGILYLHRITDNRIVGSPLKNFRIFQRLCGKNALDKVWLVTTMWDDVDLGMGERREAELKRDYWKTMTSKGAQVTRCRSDDSSPKQIIQQILDHNASRKMMLLRWEMANLKRELQETEVGKQLEELVERQTALFQRINVERKGASNASVLADLQTEHNDLQMQIDVKLNQMQELKLSSHCHWFKKLDCFAALDQLTQG